MSEGEILNERVINPLSSTKRIVYYTIKKIRTYQIITFSFSILP